MYVKDSILCANEKKIVRLGVGGRMVLPKIRLGLIGYGSIGRVHALAYRSIPFHYGLPDGLIQIAGVATSRPETAQKAAQEIGCDFWTDDYRRLLESDKIDAVNICTPNDQHIEPVIAAAQAGKHIYCEKPLALNPEQGCRMVEAVRSAGVKGQLTFNFRFFPAISRAQQLIQEGFLGRPFSFRGRYYRSSYIEDEKPLTWKLRKETSGGGALFDLGSHVLDLLRFLLGEFHEVQATLETMITERPVAAGSTQKAPVEVDDLAFLHLRTIEGTPGLVEVSRLATGVTNDLQLEIYGEKGALRFNLGDPGWLEIYDTRAASEPLGGRRGFQKIETVQRYPGQKAPDWTQPPGFIRSHIECQYQFLKAIWEDKEPSPSLADGLHIQKLLAAALRSSAESRWVSVADVS
jgi:predicted dehydrogenase